jgi:hypothetical protein
MIMKRNTIFDWDQDAIDSVPPRPVPKDEFAEFIARHAADDANAARSQRYNDEVMVNLDIHESDCDAEFAKRPATTAAYRNLFLKRFVPFAQSREFEGELGVPYLPASPGLVAWFLISQRADGVSYAMIRKLAAAISDVHQIKGLPDPCQNIYVRGAIRFARRHWQESKRVPKEPQQQISA